MLSTAKSFDCIDDLAAALRTEDLPPPRLLQDAVEFEFVHGIEGGAKIVATGDGLRFLYRGQYRRYDPCLAQVWRQGQPSDDPRLNWALSRTRVAEFAAL